MDTRTLVFLLILHGSLCQFTTAQGFKSTRSPWTGSTVVQAAGRPAKLGDLYDAIRDDFTGSSAYRKKVPIQSVDLIPKASSPHLSFHVVNDYSERSSYVGVSVSLQTSSYLGLTDIRGTLQAFSKYKLRKNCVNGLLVYKFQKGIQRLNLLSPLLEDSFVPHVAEHVSGTHVLVEVLYGSEVVVGFNFEISEHDTRSTAESQISGEMDRMIQSFGASKTWDASQETFVHRSSTTLEIFGDIEGYSDFEVNITEIYKALKAIPKKLAAKKSNGTPLSYRLYSVDRVKKIVDVESSEKRSAAKTNSTRGWRRRQRRMEKKVLSLCYMNDAIKYQYDEEMDRMQRYRAYIPDHYIERSKAFYAKYAEDYEQRMAQLKDMVLSCRSNPHKKLKSRVTKVISAFENSTNGPVLFQTYLKELSRNMTQKTSDVNTLLAAGFTWINKTSTSDDIALRTPMAHIMFISQEWRNQSYSQFLDCLATGFKLRGEKYVTDCDFEVQKPLCSKFNAPVILEYCNGFTKGTTKCVTREVMASSEFKRAESVLTRSSPLIPRLPFFSS